MTKDENKETVQDGDPFKVAVKKYLSSSTNDKESDQFKMFKDLSEGIKNANDIPELAYKVLLRPAISNMVRRFINKGNKSNTKLLVDALSSRNIKLGLKYLCDAAILSYPNNPGYITKATAKNGSILIRWICELLMKLENMGNEKDLIECSFEAFAAIGVHSVSNDMSKKLSQKCLTKLRKIMKFDLLVDIFKKLSSYPEGVVALCCLLYSKDDQIDKEIMSFFCEAFSKAILLPKIKAPNSLICGTSDTIKKITKNEWDELIMPNVKKAMLRSPEVATFGVRQLIEYCSIDLSGFALDIMKSLGGGLISSDESLQINTLNCIETLFKKLTSVKAIEDCVNSLFDVLNGSQGKITNASQKVNVLSAIEKGTFNSVSPGDKKEIGKVASNVILKLSKPLSSESNESAVIAFYQCLGEWSALLTEKCPSIVNIFENALKIPVAQEHVRYCALLSMTRFMDCQDPVDFCPQLKKMLESIIGGKSNLNTETIPIIYILTKYEVIEKNVLSKDFYEKLCNFKATDEMEIYEKLGKDGFILLSKLIFLVINNRPYDDVLGNYPEILLKLSIFGLIYPSFNVRNCFHDTIKKITKNDGYVFGDFALNIFFNNVQNGYFEKIYLKIISKNISEPNEDKKIPAAHLVSAIKILTPEPEDDSVMLSKFNEFLVTLLLAYSLDKVFHLSGGQWAEMVQKYDSTLKVLNKDEFRDILMKRLFELSMLTVKENAIQLLVSLEFGRHEIVDFIWKYFEDYFKEFEIGFYFNIPESNVKIYHTPENVLFNTSVMEDKELANLDTRGMSKKEQAAEIALRKELAEKRRKEGKLTEGQKKAIAEELEKESEIRKEMKKLYENVYEPFRLLIAASKSNPLGVTKHLNIMYDVVIPLLQSDFISPIAVDTLFAFRDAIFEPSPDYLHQLVIITTLRLFNSKKLIDGWCEEPLNDQLKRMIASLTSMCAVVAIPDEFMTEADLFMDNEGMNASKLGFLLPLIEKIMTTKDFDSTIKTSLTSFLQDGVSLKFIKGEDVLLVPYLKLATMTLPILIENHDTELIKPCTVVLQNLANIMSECTIPTEKMEQFLHYLLDHLKEPNEKIRIMIINMLYNMHHQVSVLIHQSKAFKAKLVVILSIIINDEDEKVNQGAIQLWKHLELKLPVGLFSHIFNELMDVNEFIRKGASNIILKIVTDMPKLKITIINMLFDLYVKHSKIVEAEYDTVGRLLRAEYDEWEKRSGIAEALIKLANTIKQNEAFDFLKKIVNIGLLDHNAAVRQKMLKVAEAIITKHGRDSVNEFYPFLEEKLVSLSTDERDDIMRQGLVILLGTLTKYLDPNDKKILEILMKLMSTLTTPSQPVQESICSCLPALIASRPEDGKVLLKSMLTSSAKFSTYGERRGAAYGVAGIVKGLGIKSMKEQQVDVFLKNGFKNKKDPRMKEACCLLMEMLGYALGQSFEPYILELLPDLLSAYGDSNENVRLAAEDACNCIMSKISNFGVKLILPVVLEVIDKDAWRTKVVCVKLLGNMAITAPKQLSVCLASVVPKLIECLADSHSKVQSSAENALKKISTVIKNPEMLTISSHLIDALIDPGNKTVSTLTTILNIRFAHFIDTPSLSMMMPIVKRGFDEKSTEGRRMAANIIANIYQLADKRDMEHYLYEIMPGLKKSLFDPVPDIRAICAKAIGSIIKYAIGESSEKLQAELLPWLSQKLISEESVVERSGAAQGLSEIYYGIGEDSLDDIMPQIINKLNQPNLPPHVRDGFTLMYIYLPLVFQNKFAPYLSQVIPSILRGLSDENEFVRDSSLKAGQRLITQYCTTAQKLLLPQLQTAITDAFWRIRHAAVTLIGDLLFTVSGVSGKMTSNTAEEDDTFGIDEANSAIIRKLGQETRDQIFASLYLCRNDTAGQVRTAATHVWKIVVSNTPRTLKEIMTTLFSQILDCLSSTSEDRQIMAGKCLGELVKKMGEKIMTDVLPVITKQLDSDNSLQRQGVATALGEIVDNTNSEIVFIYAENLIEPIKRCLSDEDEGVRESAVKLFTAFYKVTGNIALDEIVVPLLKDIDDIEKSERVIGGLCAVVQSNSRQMMSYLLPKLTKPPVNVVALCKISAAAGDSLGKNLPKILEALLDNCENTDNEEQIDNCLPVLLSVDDYEGISQIISTLITRASKKDHIPSAMLFSRFVSKSDCDFDEFINQILPGTLSLYNSKIPEIVDSAIKALISLTSNMEQSVQFNTIPLIQSCIQKMMDIGEKEQIPGFNHPKGISPFLPILREGIINGGVELKQKSGETLGNIVLLSTQTSLKSHVVNATGPLIRVLGDRYPPEVKIAIIQTLSRLLDKVINFLSAFLPQLQSTFIKAIQEPSSRKVRLAAGGALAKLIQIHPKPENIVSEFIKLLSNLEDETLLLSTVISLRALIKKIGSKLSKPTIDGVISIAKKYINNTEDVVKACGALYGEAIPFCDQWPLNILNEINKGTTNQKLFCLTCLQLLATENVDKMIDVYGYENISNTLSANFSNESPSIADASLRTAGYILISKENNCDKDLLQVLAKTINHNSNDIKRLVAVVIQNIFKHISNPSNELLKAIVPSLINGTKERNLAVRVSSEYALLEVFKLRKSDNIYEEYVNILSGGVKAVLVDTYQKQLVKALKNNDDSLESLDNMLTVE